MDPLVEIVIHDLSSEKITYFNGKLSNRAVGDPSLLGNPLIEKDFEKIIYPKINFDGRLIKSISVPLDMQWLICINCDISIWGQIKDFAETFMRTTQTQQPKALFKEDWHEKLHIAIHTHLNTQKIAFETLNTHQKKELVYHLFSQGAFEEKNAADYIAKTLNMGRATIYKYLKEWRENENL